VREAGDGTRSALREVEVRGQGLDEGGDIGLGGFEVRGVAEVAEGLGGDGADGGSEDGFGGGVSGGLAGDLAGGSVRG